jgi:hypothetical protein
MDYIHKITRPDVEDNALYGFIVNSSEALTLIAKEYDFYLDGYMVLRNSDIEICKPTPTTRYCTRILKKEGLIPDTSDAEHIDLSSWAALLRDLKKQRDFVIVEDETSDEFLIGPIERVNKKSVTIHYFDGAGKWKEPRNILYDEVSSVSFASNYIRMYQKHIKKKA